MIVIDKNTINTIILELTASTTISLPYYLFKFTNDMTSGTKIFLSDDVSNFICRYNRFEIEEVNLVDEDLYNGKVNLVPSGFWTYNIYESATQSLSPTGSVIQTGKVLVVGDDISTPQIYR